MLDENVTSACIVFLELCELDSRPFSLDLEAAQRIYKWLLYQDSLRISVPRDESEILREVVQMFLDNSPESLMKVLQYLENSTKSLPDFQESSLGIPISKWILVSQFCLAHDLPMSSQELRELAGKNDWTSFLFEAEIQKFSPEDLLPIVENEFSDPALKAHVMLVIERLAREKKHGRENGIIIPDSSSTQLFEVLLSAKHTPSPARTLLRCALAAERPFLCIVATCFLENQLDLQVEILDCMISWLCSSCADFLVEFRTKHDLLQVNPSSTSRWNSWNADNLSEVIFALCAGRQFEFLIRAFFIFDPNNILLVYLSFHQNFTLSHWEACSRDMQSFVGLLKGNVKNFIGGVEWAEKLATQLIDLLFEKAPSTYETSHLLEFLRVFPQQHKYRRFISNFQVVQRTNVNFDIRTPSDEVINILVQRGLYDEARGYAKENEINTSQITMDEAESVLNKHQKKSSWVFEEDRMALWHRFNESLFSEHETVPEQVGDFFKLKAASKQTTLNERVTLLKMALERYKSCDPNSRTPEAQLEIDELENNVLILSTEVDLIHAHRGMVTDFNPKQILEITIGHLVEEGNISQAEKLCKQFNHYSPDLNLVKAALTLVDKSVNALPEFAIEILRKEAAQSSFAPAVQVENSSSRTSTQIPMGNAELNKIPKSELIGFLVSHCTECRPYCEKILVTYKVSLSLTLAYQEVARKDPYEVLQYLLLFGGTADTGFPLTRNFIVYFKLDPIKVATILADTYFKKRN
eukprot:TRINITY_DN7664_c0_g1_i1.p1 TRINITY_DN7664_c0_g1~~TRINITY_DN7664_c0_g1_i1.p1  ORF type:complete len:862 (-),score=301.76 TRINITY_DN7664_c0_g1_i1:1158-3416(-)